MDLLTDHELAMEFVDGNADAGYIALANMGEAHKGLQNVQKAIVARVAERLRERAAILRAADQDMRAIWSLEGMADELEAHIKPPSSPVDERSP
jgi:hypothetical protein